MKRTRWVGWLAGGSLACLAGVAALKYRSPIRVAMVRAGLARARTVDDCVREFGPKAEEKFGPVCRANGIAWPPPRVRLLAFKEEKKLEVWVAPAKGAFVKAATYDVLGASGGPGPKRKQGDCQVPEGFYRLPVLNPNSRFHVSIRVDYPNKEDEAHRVVEPADMGGDIYIHGGSASIGCLALGDPAIEEVFGLVAQVPEPCREIWISPRDLRAQNVTSTDQWIADVYRRLTERLRAEHR